MLQITVSNETYEKIKHLINENEQSISSADWIGEKMLFRLVTYFWVGRVKKIVGNLIFLEQASWVADTGKFSDFIETGEAEELEFVGDGSGFNAQAIVDFHKFKHNLPTCSK